MATSGLIFNIQKYCSHDGPGIRTTVFCKGCPLACNWCHNLEGRSNAPEPLLSPALCTGCGACLTTCPTGAASLQNGRPVIDLSRCNLCGKCVAACPQDGRQICGQEVTVDQLMTELLKDQVFYDQSGGGITFSGGEAMAQLSFLSEALTACKQASLHTAVDTCGHVPWTSFTEILPWTDLFLYDLKLMDPLRHQEATGVSNELILDNLRLLADHTDRITIRIPIIPTVNDDLDNVRQLISYLKGIRFGDVHLLPYHPLGRGKAARLGRPNGIETFPSPAAADMQRLAELFTGEGIPALVGGVA